MTVFHERKMVNHPLETLFHVVSHVADYQAFVPWVKKSRVFDDDQQHPLQQFSAELVFGEFFIQTAYTSRVTIDHQQKIIESCLIKGPLHHLYNKWSFKPVAADITEIDFFLDFDLNNPVLKRLFSPYVPIIFNKMIQAFDARALQEAQNLL